MTDVSTMPRDQKSPTVLIVDDEIELMRALCDALNSHGFHTRGFSEPEAALEELRRGDIDLVLSDLMMPRIDGIQLIRAGLDIDPNLVAIIMTGHGTVHSAVEALKAGAYDYVLKPFKVQALLPTIRRGLELRKLRLENVRLKQYVESLTFESSRYRMVGTSPPMQRVIQLLEKLAPTDTTVLIRGPSGSGKELVARALHYNSPRRDKPLVTINCASLQESLLESELFGHEKGAFTGALLAKRGLFEVAEGGTLFIDEVAEMAPSMQAKLLRVLENGNFRKLGGTHEHFADVRIIAATNKPLEDEQRSGRFREDLFYRLNVVNVILPPLKDRKEDIPALVDHFLTTRQLGPIKYSVDPEVMAALMEYNWPGNIRELANLLERAQILAEGNRITLDDLPESITILHDSDYPAEAEKPAILPEAERSQLLCVIERNHIERVMQQLKGNKVQAAKVLGISRRSLYRLLEKHQLDDQNLSNP